MTFRSRVRVLILGLLAVPVVAQTCASSKDPVTCLDKALSRKLDRSDLDREVERAEAERRAVRTELANKASLKDLNAKAEQKELDKKADKKAVEDQGFSVNRFWVLLAALLVFFMQAGFKSLEVGMVGPDYGARQGSMKMFSWIVPCILYIPVGFGLMYGTSDWALGRVVGGNLFGASGESIQKANANFGMEFLLFQLGFAGTAVSIFAGAIAERTKVISFVLMAAVMTLVIYPVFGHWAWGGSIYAAPTPDQMGWLQRRNFLDFAGSTVVHSIGGWFALMAVLVIGPRTGRFLGPWRAPDAKDLFSLIGGPRSERFAAEVNKRAFPMHSLGYSILGVFMLWFGWWGFNGGSHLKYDTTIADTVLTTNIAGAFAGLSAYLLALWRDPENVVEKLIGGALGGLVAITASCNIVTPLSAAIIGLIAGAVHNFAFDLLLLVRVDDPVGAIPVHGFCGVLGTLCVAFFKDDSKFPAGTVVLTWYQQLAVQSLGVCVAFTFTVLTAGLLLLATNHLFPLRQSKDKPADALTVSAAAG